MSSGGKFLAEDKKWLLVFLKMATSFTLYPACIRDSEWTQNTITVLWLLIRIELACIIDHMLT